MKILFVNSSLTDGGSERAMSLVANQMVEFGHEVSMVLIRNKKRTYYCHPDINLIQLIYPSLSKASILPRRLYLIRKYAKAIKPDCIVSFMWDVNVMTLVATVGLGIRIVVSERAFPGSSHRSLLSRKLEAVMYSLSSAVVYQTEGARDFCPNRLRDRSWVIPNVVAKPSLVPYAGVRSKSIVSVGRLTEQKNFPMLLEAFAKFSVSHPDYSLKIFGDGELRGKLVELSSSLGVADKIEFAGYVNNIPEQINGAAMFVLSSDYEGISNAMTEAMALGLPVVCTDCPTGGAATMIENGVNGLLVPVGDIDALAAAMSLVADDGALAQRIADQAKKVVERFSSESIGHMWERVLEA